MLDTTKKDLREILKWSKKQLKLIQNLQKEAIEGSGSEKIIEFLRGVGDFDGSARSLLDELDTLMYVNENFHDPQAKTRESIPIPEFEAETVLEDSTEPLDPLEECFNFLVETCESVLDARSSE